MRELQQGPNARRMIRQRLEAIPETPEGGGGAVPVKSAEYGQNRVTMGMQYRNAPKESTAGVVRTIGPGVDCRKMPTGQKEMYNLDVGHLLSPSQSSRLETLTGPEEEELVELVPPERRPAPTEALSQG